MELLVIGAGPYGLATAAEARRRGIATTVVGEPMHFWRRNMPGGMLLRSGREWHLDAAGVHTLDAFVGEPVDPIPVETFIAYADWFAERKGLAVREAHVDTLTEGSAAASRLGWRTARRIARRSRGGRARHRPLRRRASRARGPARTVAVVAHRPHG